MSEQTPQTGEPWTPDQPLRADATDQQIRARYSRGGIGVDTLARELAVAHAEVVHQMYRDVKAIEAAASPPEARGAEDDLCVRCNERKATQETEFMGPLCGECYIDALEGVCERLQQEVAEIPEAIAQMVEAQRVAIPDSARIDGDPLTASDHRKIADILDPPPAAPSPHTFMNPLDETIFQESHIHDLRTVSKYQDGLSSNTVTALLDSHEVLREQVEDMKKENRAPRPPEGEWWDRMSARERVQWWINLTRRFTGGDVGATFTHAGPEFIPLSVLDALQTVMNETTSQPEILEKTIDHIGPSVLDDVYREKSGMRVHRSPEGHEAHRDGLLGVANYVMLATRDAMVQAVENVLGPKRVK